MKKTLLVLLSLLMFNAFAEAQFSKSGKKEVKFISRFIEAMNHKDGPQYATLMACISKVYIKNNNIDSKTYKVDNYSSLDGYSIEDYDRKEGMIYTKIWGSERSWVHKLNFKLVKEGSKIYLIPGGHSDNYIYPWYDRETFIYEVKEPKS